MDNTQEQNPYEECLKELFNNFDSSGSGSLNPGEVSELCLSLHLDDATPALLNAVLQNQDPLTARVDFDQFKNTLILVLSSCPEPRQAEHETLHHPEYPEIQPKLVKGSKRYGRRSMPEFIDPTSDLSDVMHANLSKCQDLEDNHDLAVPRKRERWNAHDSSTEEYEAEGQMNLWKPDIPSTPRGSIAPVSNQLEEKLHEACDVLAISLDGFACPTELLALCEYLGMEINGDVFQSLNGDGVMNVQEFISKVANQNKPPTPSCSTPYWQLKRHLSIQPFREGGHRITPPSALTSTIGLRLFSALDDGSGYTPAEHILDTWMEEGIEKSTEILQALNFSPDGKLSLGDLTMALENELLVSKNGIYLAALASFKAEIRYLLERVDHEFQEKEKIRSDLEKAAKLKTQLAIEVDEHHLLIEHTNSQSLRKLEQDHKENLAALRSEVMKEMDQIQQQAVLQREELEAENEKIREDESFLRDHLSIYVKENGRLEKELFDANEKLVEAESQVTKLQMSLDNIIKEKFDDLDPGMADFFIQEECMKQLRSNYEAQCRELQDRIDELQCELQEIHSVRQTHQPCHKPLSDELENKSPGMKADPGVGSDEVPPFSMSLETEIMLEQLKEQHLREMQNLSHQLESEITEFENMVEKQRTTHEDQRVALALQHQQEVQALREEMAGIHSQTQELHTQLEQAELERTWLEQKQRLEREELENLHQEEVGALKRQLLEVHTLKAELEKQLKVLELQQAAADGGTATELQELREQHATQMKKLEENNRELFEARVEEEKKKWLEEKDKLEKRLLESSTREKELLKQSHEEDLKARLQEARHKFEEERGDIVQKLTDQWQEERAQLDEQNNKSLQVVLEEGMFRFVKEQEVKESQLKKEWESKQAQLLECQKTLLDKIFQERLQLQEQYEQREKKLKQGWEKERLQLERDFEAMCQGRLDEEKEKLETEKEKLETRLEHLMTEQKAYLEDGHREAMQELTVKHTEERNTLSSMLDILRDDIAHERSSAIRLAEENLILKQNITLLKKEDLKEAQEELIKTFDRLKYDELAANKAAQNFNKQISELCLQSQQLQYKKGILVDKDGQNIANLEKLKQQLAELIKENDRRDVFCAEEKNKLAACVSALEGELTKAQEDTARLEERNTQLSLQLSGLREKNHTLEVALHSNGFKSQSKQLHRDETSQLNEQEDDAQPREKTQLLDTTMQSRKQHKHLSQSLLVRALEQDNASLKQEQEVQKELFKGCESVERHTEMESLRQENKMLKVQVAQLSRQLFESFDIHFAGLLPLSRQKMPRGQHYAEDPEHLQDDQERKMKNMEERMKEIELSLHNVKMLLKEKVAQLNNQLRKNGKADVLIQDLYVENAMLMKMLEKTKQRYKMVEKKKYLLEEKISSLNKIVHDLNPLSLLPLSYHCKFS
ncbi:uncharacterized protein nin [Aulostomus maculatus]